MELPKAATPISEIPLPGKVRLYLKREDLVHPEISGNKYWKLYYNIHNYLEKNPENPTIVTFGGAYSNHISAVSAAGWELGIKTVGIIRGEELSESFLKNPTLSFARQNGMILKFVSRSAYRDKEHLAKIFQDKFPGAVVIPEGGTNALAVEGIHHMLSAETAQFDYLCAAVGSGGTLAGLSKFAEEGQKVLGFRTVKDAGLQDRVSGLSGRKNFNIIDASFGGYGKINDDLVRFINEFYEKFGIPLEPLYTGKMLKKLLELIAGGSFPEGAKILAFHTGGLQGIAGANQMLAAKNRPQIQFKNY